MQVRRMRCLPCQWCHAKLLSRPVLQSPEVRSSSPFTLLARRSALPYMRNRDCTPAAVWRLFISACPEPASVYVRCLLSTTQIKLIKAAKLALKVAKLARLSSDRKAANVGIPALRKVNMNFALQSLSLHSSYRRCIGRASGASNRDCFDTPSQYDERKENHDKTSKEERCSHPGT
ncbi:uncharacterized protein L969DRAFT_465910 [Mixia osmundae IAM 14324]|uniref:uncharacterized protein n=1 Tax=Mixia osmundae (strain CBS 9802 / IAM 14324 / JCM 22182 / KY 12970) TaxID=764103 RepID=UPI0004A5526E|nr:uncharacterized protein L969DRAFT_465910 [Mixia osmundae IAM 14324]KEI39755.1 hypothetical protein L969DRAFT_465910 [Mixia osmundae IAM 14324]